MIPGERQHSEAAQQHWLLVWFKVPGVWTSPQSWLWGFPQSHGYTLVSAPVWVAMWLFMPLVQREGVREYKQFSASP